MVLQLFWLRFWLVLCELKFCDACDQQPRVVQRIYRGLSGIKGSRQQLEMAAASACKPKTFLRYSFSIPEQWWPLLRQVQQQDKRNCTTNHTIGQLLGVLDGDRLSLVLAWRDAVGRTHSHRKQSTKSHIDMRSLCDVVAVTRFCCRPFQPDSQKLKPLPALLPCWKGKNNMCPHLGPMVWTIKSGHVILIGLYLPPFPRVRRRPSRPFLQEHPPLSFWGLRKPQGSVTQSLLGMHCHMADTTV